MRKHFACALITFLYLLSSPAYAQNVTVNPGGGSYATLKAAFDAINAGTHTGALQLNIVNNTTETSTATLNASGSGAASYSSIEITPQGNVSISGNLALPLISLNGADNVTIDGLNTGGNSLTITNQSTSINSSTSTIRLINDATNNTITNCTLQGSSTRPTNTTIPTGIVLLGTGTSTGNDNNRINNNNIGSPGSNLSSRGITSIGSSGAPNSGIEIRNNNIYDIFNATYSAAIYLNDHNVNWSISNNRIYQTNPRTGTGTGIHYGIWIDGSTTNAEDFSITGNTIGYASSNGSGLYVISGSATTFQAIAVTGKTTGITSNISNNTISGITIGNTTTSVNYAINFNAAAAGGVPLTISNNTVSGITSSGNIYSIAYTGLGSNQASTITGNTITGINLTGPARFYGILYNGGDGGSSSVISNNTINAISQNGNPSGSALGSPAFTAIYGASGPAVVENNIVGGQAVTSSISCIQSAASTSSFDLLGIFVKGVDNFTIRGNSIGGLYADNLAAASGTARIFGIRTSSSGIVIASNNTIGGNVAHSMEVKSNFGGTSLLGIYNSAGSSTFNENTLRNFTSGAGTGTAANSALLGIYNASNNTTVATGNLIYNLTTTGSSVAGIIFGTGTSSTISGNSIFNINSTSTLPNPVVTGLQVIAGTTTNVSRNKIYDISLSSPFTSLAGVNGLLVSGGTAVNAFNNMIGGLTAPLANSIDGVRGISITGTAAGNYNIYFNTVYVNASSSGADFGSSALFHAANSASLVNTLDLRNNILVNTSLSSGAGLTVAFRRWQGTGTAADLANYALTSNNNLFYAGMPGPANLIYSDSVNGDQTLAAFQARVAPRETGSVTENPPFISTNGPDASFLHINPSIATQVESGGVSVPTYTDDFDGQVRQGNPGYSGSGSAPDIGADEGEFTPVILPVTLLNFHGEKTRNGNQLSWTTHSEVNNRKFELQHSVDGRHFSTIAGIPSKAANGNSTSILRYSFTDSRPFVSNSYYRLMQVDMDGNTKYSGIVLIKEKRDVLTINRTYPNPAEAILHIALSSPLPGKVSIAVIDMEGRTVMHQTNWLAAGENFVQLPVNNLQAANYILEIAGMNGDKCVPGRFLKR